MNSETEARYLKFGDEYGQISHSALMILNASCDCILRKRGCAWPKVYVAYAMMGNIIVGTVSTNGCTVAAIKNGSTRSQQQLGHQGARGRRVGFGVGAAFLCAHVGVEGAMSRRTFRIVASGLRLSGSNS
jgi:hypothetical protein